MTLSRRTTLQTLCAAALAVPVGAAMTTPADARPALHLQGSTASRALPHARPEFPHPSDPNQIFFLQRTMNANTVVYAAAFDSDGRLNRRQPVTAYWRRFAGAGQIMPLRWYERVFAFGTRTRARAGDDGFDLSWNAKRDMTVELRQDAPFRAALWTRFGNRDFQLIYAYLDLDESGTLPRVERLRAYSSDPVTGLYMTHLFAVSGGEYQE